MNKNQHGFSIFILLIALVILGTVSFGGWYLVKNNTVTQSPDNSLVQITEQQTAIPTNSLTETDAEPKIPALAIDEWDIRIIPAKQLPNLSYRIVKDNNLERALLKFEDLSANCDGFYWFSRAKSGEDIDGYGTTPEKYTTINPSIVKKLGDYYYFFGHGQLGCGAEGMNEQRILLGGEDNTSYRVEALN